MLKARDQFKDAAGVYFRISGEEPLHSAVMLEQASYCFLLSTPTMSEETGKTYEVLRLQLPVINFPLIKVVFEDHRTYASTAAHAEFFLMYCFLFSPTKIILSSDIGGGSHIFSLWKLPSANTGLVTRRIHAASVRESLWKSLEEDMIPSLSVMKTNWLESQQKVLPKKYKESNVCVAGEAIKVDISFRNPLQIPISISNVSLICKHSAEFDETESDANGFLIDHQNDKELRAVSNSGEFSLDTSLFTLSEIDISMRGGETILVQLTVTPKIEGSLKVVGVRWKLSGSVVGICNFNSDIIKKKVAKGNKKRKQPMKDNLQFLVIKSLPRLEGIVDNFPKTVYAGDLRRLTLELRNPSKISVKNLKMKISHPRYLIIADQEVMNSEFPTCLRKQESSSESCTQVDAARAASSLFVFPETTAISSETPLKWPLWFRAAAAGSISLYITIYYEVEDESSVITYRTLRMHYNVEVLPSLEVSFRTSPCSSKLQEFLIRMDVINRTSSESFQIHQLSCVGDQWELVLLQPVESVSSWELLIAGQALSCFFKLKNCRTRQNTEENTSSLVTSGRADVKLVDGDSRGLYDTSDSPFTLFHHHERVHQERQEQGHGGTVDFILISESRSGSDAGVASKSPIWWLMDGPRSVRHDFSAAFCEINLSLTVYNSSEDVVSVRIVTLDYTPAINSATSAASVSGNEVGWHDISHPSEIKVTSDVTGVRGGKAPSTDSVSPFIWSGTSSTRFNLEPFSSAPVPLQICVFSPGTFDLSNYILYWNLVSSSDGGHDVDGPKVSSGTCQGHSYHVAAAAKRMN
ncbi:UNVERIFIED_CONTAM: hypothetical protein Scaly_1714700 [Sesamum calycinum]|uniref:Uncharacterized protein n=1 Tax=Sesamum calycinum TaxID=2727403 RepID=A0AAW2NTU2_9LAMI